MKLEKQMLILRVVRPPEGTSHPNTLRIGTEDFSFEVYMDFAEILITHFPMNWMEFLSPLQVYLYNVTKGYNGN